MSVASDIFIDSVGVGNLIIGVFSFFPMILNFKYYKKTKLFDYLLISSYFFFWAILVVFGMIYLGWLSFLEGGGIAGDFAIIDLIFGKFFLYFGFNGFDALPLCVLSVSGSERDKGTAPPRSSHESL